MCDARVRNLDFWIVFKRRDLILVNLILEGCIRLVCYQLGTLEPLEQFLECEGTLSETDRSQLLTSNQQFDHQELET